MRWQDLEIEVRKLAESIWAVTAAPEVVGGVKWDNVLKIRPDYWVLVEVSKQNTLAKLREDLAKFQLVKPGLLAKGIYAECYFVTSGDHLSLVESGQLANVEVHDLRTFANKFIGWSQYVNERSRKPFGSAVNPDSGEKDEAVYTSTEYVGEDGVSYSVADISRHLESGRRIVLVGEFGTGKSRCLMEVFRELASLEHAFVPIAINLRDNWGYKRLAHVIQNHLDMLGLGQFTNSLVRSLNRGNHVLLLDGIDEIGSQSWSGDAARLTETRKLSLEGVRDIIQSASGSGILLTGREHYFGSDDEMAECLGLSRGQFLKLRCRDEFSSEEIAQYLRSNTGLQSVPDWMPRKPLICQLLARLEAAEVERLERATNGEVEFFESIFDAICARETRISKAIYKDILKGILLTLAQETRKKSVAAEQISTIEINEVFFKVAGYAPIDESAILLQRLPYLGRVGSGGSDRIFVDPYARDGLRGLSLARIFLHEDKSILTERWQQSIGGFGLDVLASKVKPNSSLEKFIRLCVNHGNEQSACDYVQLKLFDSDRAANFGGITINNGSISELSFVGKDVENLHIAAIEVSTMEIEDSTFKNVSISHCTIDRVKGIGSADRLPDVFQDCVYGAFQSAHTVARISELSVSSKHKTLLAIIKKLFFQPGRGRQAEALLRGAENYWDPKAADEILRYMLHNGLIDRVQGDHGDLYVPLRRHTRRMGTLWELRSTSRDELWNMLN